MERAARPAARLRRRGRGSSLARYLGADEQPILVTRQHPLALARAATRALGLLAPLALAAWGIAGVEALRGDVGTWFVRVLVLAMLGVVLGLAWRVVEWEFERVVVTNEKVIHLEGVVARRIASTPVTKVSEFTVRQPLLGRMFDYGMLVVDVPGGRDQALHGLSFLPDPTGVYRLVSDLGRRGRVQEGGGAVEDVAEVVARDLPATGPLPHAPAAAPRDPWQPTLEGAAADHTIEIPRVDPPGRR
ncbi:MAG: hypothetical protein JWM98_2229 [Thermoleophilia bacterium]|nr:hypothetical protein [Thermoleophilia bacterium]